MIYFTSDTHFGDDRLNLYGRDLVCKDSKEMDQLIIDNWNETVSPDDIVHLAAVFMNEKIRLIRSDMNILHDEEELRVDSFGESATTIASIAMI